MKPHTFQPARIGFFFREADGSVHASASYREDVLEALPIRQMPAGAPAGTAVERPSAARFRQDPVSVPVIARGRNRAGAVPEPRLTQAPPPPRRDGGH